MADAQKPSNAFKAYVEGELAVKIDKLDPLGDAVKAYVNSLASIDGLSKSALIPVKTQTNAFGIIFGYELIGESDPRQVIVFFYEAGHQPLDILSGLKLRNKLPIANHTLEQLLKFFDAQMAKEGLEAASIKEENFSGRNMAKSYLFIPDSSESLVKVLSLAYHTMMNYGQTFKSQ